VEAGASYAEFREALADHETLGSVGGRNFGVDAGDDTDAAAWKSVRDSHAGQAVKAVAQAAFATLDRPHDPSIEDAVARVSRLGAFIDDMADREPAAPSTVELNQSAVEAPLFDQGDGHGGTAEACSCAYDGCGSVADYTHMWITTTFSAYDWANCRVSQRAVISKQSPTTCTRTYYVNLKRWDYSVLESASCTGSPCAAWTPAWTVPWPKGGTVNRRGKYWDAIHTAPEWRWMSCSVPANCDNQPWYCIIGTGQPS
jgi:hypothetical protein